MGGRSYRVVRPVARNGNARKGAENGKLPGCKAGSEGKVRYGERKVR